MIKMTKQKISSTLLLITIFILLFSNCKKKKLQSELEFAKKQNLPNELNVSINEKRVPFVLKFTNKTEGRLRFYMYKPKNKNINEEEMILTLSTIDLKIGVSRIKSNYLDTNLTQINRNSFRTQCPKFDVSKDSRDYYLVNDNDSLNNYLEITEIKNNNTEIYGNFSVTFQRVRKAKYTQFPDLGIAKFRTDFHLFVQ
jgi:hypothetical protein